MLSPREVVNNARRESVSMLEDSGERYHPKMLKSSYLPPNDITVTNMVDVQTTKKHKFGIKDYNPRALVRNLIRPKEWG